MNIILSETKAAVPPCPSSLIYTAKSRRQATTAVARFIRCSVRHVSKEGLKHSNRAQIAFAHVLPSLIAVAPVYLPPQHQHVQCSVLHGARVVAKVVCIAVLSCSHLLFIPATCNAQLATRLARNAVHSSSINVVRLQLVSVGESRGCTLMVRGPHHNS